MHATPAWELKLKAIPGQVRACQEQNQIKLSLTINDENLCLHWQSPSRRKKTLVQNERTETQLGPS